MVLLFCKPTFLQGNTVGLYVWVSVMYVLWCTTFTTADTAYWSILPSLTGDLRQRDQVTTLSRILSSIGGLAVIILTLRVVSLLGGAVPNVGFLKLAIVLGVLFIFFMLIALFTVKDHVVVKQDKKFSLKDAFNAIKNNDQLMWLITVSIILQIAYTTIQAVGVYYFKYVWQDTAMYSYNALIMGLGGMIGIVAYPMLSKKMPRRNVVILSYSFWIGGLALAFVGALISINLPHSLAQAFISIPAAISAFGYGISMVVGTIMLADTVDYGEWKLGYRNESIIFSMQTFFGKFGSAMSAVILSIGLSIAGFISVASDKASGASEQSLIKTSINAQTNLPRLNVTLTFIHFIIPILLIAIAILIFTKKYRLHGEYISNIRNELVGIREKKNIEYDLKHANENISEHLKAVK
jgi:melibiose permease